MNELQLKAVKVGSFAVLALAALLYVYHFSRSIDRSYPPRTFSVEGVGEIESVPDLATFSVSVVTEGGRSVPEVQRLNAEKMNKITEYLKNEGIEAKDLKTTQYNLNPRYTYTPCVTGNCPPPTINGFSLTQTLAVKVRNTEKLGSLLSGVVQNGGNSVSDVQFVVDDDTAAKDAARKEAMEKARSKAESIARAGGFQLGKIVSLYETTDAPMPYAYGMGGGAMDTAVVKSAPPTIEPGVQSSRVQINLTYEIVQ